MSRKEVHFGYVPLTDCAVPVMAAELGFAHDEGIELVLHREASWAAVRDKLVFGHLDAAHLLSPIPVAMSMGLGGMAVRIDALAVLSVNGDVIGVSGDLAKRMREKGGRLDFLDAKPVGRALIDALDGPLRLGVPYPFSMHAELVYYWLNALGLASPEGLLVRTVPPSQMAAALDADEIDAFCVGEPWGSIAVERAGAELLLPGCAIWQFAPEKVLAVRHGWAEENAETAAALMRACWKAARWLSGKDRVSSVAGILSEPRYLDVSAEIIERSLSGRLKIDATGAEGHAPGFIEFFEGAATFPWRSQAAWIAVRLAQRNGLDASEAAALARSVFRSDLYRSYLASLGAVLPGASEKIEGGMPTPTRVAASTGEVLLGPDSFFDGQIFDPAAH